MAEYPLRSLGELCEVTIGRQRSPRHATGDNMVPYLRSANVKVGHLALEDVKLMNFTPSEQEVYRLEPGDVLVTEGCGSPPELGASAPWSGEISEPVCFQNTLLRLRAIDGVSNPKYLSAIATWCHRFGRWLEASSGTSILHIGLNRAKAIRVPSPRIEIQRVIGEFLSAYDELIENNARRIEILEEMAQAIYREWFVDFRYPGHEDVPLVDSELGPIPEGWEVQSASEALDISPSTRCAKDSLNPFVPMTSVSGSHMHVHPVELKVGNSGAKFRNGDTLFARITPCLENGKTAYVQFLDHDQVGFGSTELIVLRGKEVGPEFTYLLARSEGFRGNAIASMSGATGRQRVRNECFDTFLLAVPPSSIADSFSQCVRPMFELSNTLFKANAVLRETRDLLLPRLISGEIDVSELEIELADSSV